MLGTSAPAARLVMRVHPETNSDPPLTRQMDEPSQPKVVRRIEAAEDPAVPLKSGLKYAILGTLIVIAWLLFCLILRSRI